MDQNSKERILNQAIESWRNNKNKFNYMSLKEAKTKNELISGKDSLGNPIFIKSNLDKEIIHFGTPSSFNDKREFEFVCPEKEWIGFLIQNDDYIKKFFNEYNKHNDFEKALKVFPNDVRISIEERRNKLRLLGKHCADKYKDNYGVYCLAPSSYNSYFWKNYCNNFNGICCEYDVDKICENKNILRMKVAYSDDGVAYLPEFVNINNFPEINTSIFTNELKNKLGKSPEKSKDAILKLMCTKPNKWNQELETRLVIMLEDHDGNVVNSPEVCAFPLKIYVGYRVSDEIKDYFRCLCSEKNISFEIVDESMCVDFNIEMLHNYDWSVKK